MKRSKSLLMVGLVGGLALLVLLAGCGGQIGGDVSSGQSGVAGTSNTVTVTGRATVTSTPDEAVVTLTVEKEAATAPAAMDAASVTTQQVMDRLKADGIEDSAIETASVTLYPIRTYDPNTGKETLTGYRAQNTITVTLSDAPTVGKVLAAGVETGVNNVSGPVWRLRDDSAAVNEALTQAATNARGRAEALAAAEGAKIGKVITMSEGTVDVPFIPVYRSYDMAEEGVKAAEPPISPANLDVTATVTVTYVLER